MAETLFAMVGIVAVALMLKYVDLSKINDDFSSLQFCIRVSVVFCFLVFRSPSFSHPSMVMNYVDKSGLFLIREGVVVAIGYYQVALLLVDALGRMKGLRNPSLARRLVIQPSYEGTESR